LPVMPGSSILQWKSRTRTARKEDRYQAQLWLRQAVHIQTQRKHRLLARLAAGRHSQNRADYEQAPYREPKSPLPAGGQCRCDSMLLGCDRIDTIGREGPAED